LRLFYAWLGNGVIDDQSTLDVWRETDTRARRGYVVHYLIDFAYAFGALGLQRQHEHDGYATHFDLAHATSAALRFGLWQPRWEGIPVPGLRGVGRYEAAHLDPGVYAPENAYAPFFHADDRDAYWAAKILARFDPAQLAAAVDQAQYSDPHTRTYLIAIMRERQRALVRYWLARANAIDVFTIERAAGAERLCARDLMIAYRFSTADAARYGWRAYDASGRALGPARSVLATPEGRLCTGALESSPSLDEYTLVTLHTERSGHALPQVIVHLARDPHAPGLRLIGIERQ
jgi:hypothetical protein